MRSARERNNGSLGYAEALLTYYNKKTRYPLRWSKLYNDSNDNDAEDESSDAPDNIDTQLTMQETDGEAEIAGLPLLENL